MIFRKYFGLKKLNRCDPESQCNVNIFTVQLLHSRLVLIVSMSVEEALYGPCGDSVTSQLVSLLQHLLNIILAGEESHSVSGHSLVLTHLCWSLAWVFFISSNSTTIDCF